MMNRMLLVRRRRVLSGWAWRAIGIACLAECASRAECALRLTAAAHCRRAGRAWHAEVGGARQHRCSCRACCPLDSRRTTARRRWYCCRPNDGCTRTSGSSGPYCGSTVHDAHKTRLVSRSLNALQLRSDRSAQHRLQRAVTYAMESDAAHTVTTEWTADWTV